jgi:RNA polymerase sigma-70 factor (sigma-E family)
VRDVEFAEFFAARVGALRRTAYLLCGDWHRAEDLTQTAFAKLYAAWPRLRDPGAAEAYLRRTLTHTYLDDNRRSWRREDATDPLPESVALDTTADDTDERLALLDALATVPPRQRACLVLRFFDDLSVEATAAALDCSAGTVKSNTARGLDALRRVLGADIPEFTTAGGDLA